MTFKRITSGPYDGYQSADGRVQITDNGAGLGAAAGNGRWALVINGRWVANIDTLAAAKAQARSAA